MGQATMALPNPLDAPPPASVSGTDDLLAQLAGDEIDRLLAEAEVERGGAPTPKAAPSSHSAPAAAPAAATPAPTPAAVASATESAAPFDPAAALANDDELDKLLNELNKPLPKPAAPPAAVEPPKKSLTDQVPEVLAQLGELPASVAASEVPPATAIETPPLENVMSSAEREALSLSNLEAATAAAEQEDAAAVLAAATIETRAETTELLIASVRPNLAIRVLELMNAPMSFIPDGVRDTLGKAAIVTLVNALAVLIYVVLVRH